MKKWLRRFGIAALVITVILYAMRWTTVQKDSAGTPYIEKTVKNNDVSLWDFIASTNTWKYEKIKVINDSFLEWYKLVSGDEQVASMALQQKVKLVSYEVDKTEKPYNSSLLDLGIPLTGKTQILVATQERWVLSRILIDQILPTLFFFAAILFFFKMFGPKGWAGGMPFNIQIGKRSNKETTKTKFSDVAWMDEAKEELVEIVDFLKNPEKYKKAWARVPKWVLLYWPPGSGKTLLARAVAGEAEVPFFSASGSEFMEMLVGMWAAKVRELFNKAKAWAPSIIFIDEIDAIGKKRWWGMTGGHQEQEQTLNQILTEMDGFDQNTKIIVIAATNRPDTLDPALMRSGRFDRKVLIGRPTLEERVLITKYHLKNKQADETVNVDAFARRTSWFVGADIENVINEAALKAAKDWKSTISNNDIEYGLEKLVMWPEKKIKSLKEKEKHIVTYHELWHAVTAFNLPEADPVEKISIVSRWMALWVTWMMPVEDSYLSSKAKFNDEMVSLLGWRAAEEIFFGKEHITTGASNDFERVTKIARDMIMKYGMDDELGQIVYMDKDNWERQSFKPFSEQTAQVIDKKVTWLVAIAYQKAVALLTQHKVLMEKLSKILYEKEYLSKEEFELIMKAPIDDVDSIVANMSQTYREGLAAIEKK
jgi:cell division protease FtsH